jgi:uncharacterized protein with HEPN domain
MARASRGLKLRLLDIQTEIVVIREHLAGVDFDAFVGNRGLRHIIQHALLIISEAARQIPDSMALKHPSVPWHAVKSFGNVLRHEYFNVDPDLVWDIAENYLDELEAAVIAMQAELDT